MDGLLVGRQVEVVAEGLPAHGAGVEPLAGLGGGAGALGLILRVGVVGLGVGLSAPLTDGPALVNLRPVAVDFPFPVELTVPHQALGVSKLLPTQVAFVVLLPRVDRQVLGEVEGFPERLPADVAGVGLLPRVDAVVAPQSLASPEPLPADVADMGPLRAVPAGPRTPPPSHYGPRVPLLAGLAGPFQFGVGVAGVGQRHGGAAAGSIALVHLGRGGGPPGGHSHVPKPQASQQASDDVPALLPAALTGVDVAGGGGGRGDGRHGTAGDLVLGVVQQGGEGEVRLVVVVLLLLLLTLGMGVESRR